MKHQHLMFVACALLACFASPVRAIDKDAVMARLNEAHETGFFTGYALVTVDDSVVFESGIGEIRPDLIATADTPWRIASITKQVTAVMVMQAVERGQLRLDDRLGDLLPAFKTHSARNVTVEQLLRHTSGLANPSDTPLSAGGMPVFYTVPKADHAFCAGPMRAAAGSFNYNNCDYYLLADILEAVTGKTYPDLLQTDIIQPLALKTMQLYAADQIEAFLPQDDGGIAEPPFEMLSYEAAGGLSASANDLRKFNSALMSGTLLKAESLSAFWKGEPSLGYVALGAWSYQVQPTGCTAPLKLVERRGGIGHVATLNLIWPERKASIILFSTGPTDWGQLWQDSGLMRDIVVAAWCN